MTVDSQYNDLATSSLLSQVGRRRDVRATNHVKEISNDDQAWWALSAMTAAESQFPDPPPDRPHWLVLVQAVFVEQTRRWDMATCGGGLRCQILFTSHGWHYKNTISNDQLFQFAARLARYTRIDLYVAWAVKTWDWMASMPIMTPYF
jgi:mannan endo-1,6-alpha-mannosidase